MLAGSFHRNIEAHPGSDQGCLPNHLSPSVQHSHLLQDRRDEDILCARPRVRARLRRPWPVSVLVLEQSINRLMRCAIAVIDWNDARPFGFRNYPKVAQVVARESGSMADGSSPSLG